MVEYLYESLYLMEDFRIFKEIQIEKYLKEKRVSKITRGPEFDMIVDLVKDYWLDLLATGYLNKKRPEEKKKIYYDVTIVFPFGHIPEEWSDGVIHIDFASLHEGNNDTEYYDSY